MRIIQRPKVCRGRHRLAAASPLQQPSAVDQHHPSSSAGDQQQPPSAVDQQPPSAADQHRRPSPPGDQQQPPSAAKTPQLPSAAKQQQPPSPCKQPQPLSEQHQPLSSGEQQTPFAAKQHQSPSAGESSQPQLPSPGDCHRQPSAAVKHQPLSAADRCQPQSAGEQQQGVLQTINKLRVFNHSLTLFLSSFDALSEHPNRVSTSIAAASQDPSKPGATVLASPISELETIVLASPVSELETTVLVSPVSELETSFDALSEHPNRVSTSIAAASQDPNKPEPKGATVLASPIPQLETTILASPVSELDTSCRRWEALRKYVTARLSDVDRLRVEVPVALQRTLDPARVVLNCISSGRYHLNSFTNNHKVTQRRVCILILEFYLSGCFPTQHELIRGKIDSNAVRVALEWRERIICKGGIASAGAVDALGLVLFLGSFGVPEEFSLEDLCELLLLSKSEKEAHVLRRSPFLLEKMPGVISYMVSKDMHVEAVDIVFLFGLKEKFDPLSMLSCLLHKGKQASEKEMRDEQLSLISVKESNEKYLTVLESVARCLEVYKLDSSGFDFNIEQMIMTLRTKNAEIVRKLKDRNIKRKNAEIVQKLKDRIIKRDAEEAGPLYAPETLPKRPRPSATELTREIPGI